MRFRALGLALLTLAALALAACGAGGTSRASLHVRPGGAKGLYALSSSYQVTFSWTLPAFAATTGYNTFQDGSQVGSPAGSPYVFSSLACGQTYTLGVQAHNGSGGTGPTYSTSYTTPACPTGGGGAQQLNCFAQPAACGYPDYYYGNTSGNLNGPTSFTVADNAWSDSTGINPTGKTGAGVGPVCDSALVTKGACTSGQIGTAVACSALPSSGTTSFSNTTVEGFQFSASLSLGSNTTLKNVCVVSGGGNGAANITFNSASNVTIDDSVLTGTNAWGTGTTTWPQFNIALETATAPILVRHSALITGQESIHYHPIQMIDSYVLGTGDSSSGAHHEDQYSNNDFADSNVSLLHNTELEPYWDSGGPFFGDNTTANSACFDSLDMEYSLLAGGNGVILLCGKSNSTSVQAGTTFKFIDNNFARCTTSPGSGVSGTCTGSCPLTTSSEPSGICLGATDRAGGFDTHGYYPNGGLSAGVDLGGTGFSPSGTNGGICPLSSNTYHTATTFTGNVWDDISDTALQGDRTNGAAVPCVGGQ